MPGKNFEDWKDVRATLHSIAQGVTFICAAVFLMFLTMLVWFYTSALG